MSGCARVIDIDDDQDEVAEVQWETKRSKRRGTYERAEKVKKSKDDSQNQSSTSSHRNVPAFTAPLGNVYEEPEPEEENQTEFTERRRRGKVRDSAIYTAYSTDVTYVF